MMLRKEGFKDDCIIMGTTTRLHPQKGLQFLIKAIPSVLAKCPKAHLVIFGTGPLKTQLVNLSSSLGISNHVHFLGFRENIYEWITGLDIFVLPSLAEGHSISLLEAMRAGLPIICTPVGDNLETIRPDRDGIPFGRGSKARQADAHFFFGDVLGRGSASLQAGPRRYDPESGRHRGGPGQVQKTGRRGASFACRDHIGPL